MAEDIEIDESRDDGLVVVFRAATPAEAKEVADVLFDKGLESEIDRELGAGYVEYTDHHAEEDMASFVVLVEERHAEYAGRLLSDLGFDSMVPPELMESQPRPGFRAFQRWVLLALGLLLVVWTVFVLFHAF